MVAVFDPANTIALEYEMGRSDGYADGAHDFQWHPAAIDDNLGRIREYVAGCRTRGCRAYHLGELRGYREAVGIGGRT